MTQPLTSNCRSRANRVLSAARWKATWKTRKVAKRFRPGREALKKRRNLHVPVSVRGRRDGEGRGRARERGEGSGKGGIDGGGRGGGGGGGDNVRIGKFAERGSATPGDCSYRTLSHCVTPVLSRRLLLCCIACAMRSARCFRRTANSSQEKKA